MSKYLSQRMPPPHVEAVLLEISPPLITVVPQLQIPAAAKAISGGIALDRAAIHGKVTVVIHVDSRCFVVQNLSAIFNGQGSAICDKQEIATIRDFHISTVNGGIP